MFVEGADVVEQPNGLLVDGSRLILGQHRSGAAARRGAGRGRGPAASGHLFAFDLKTKQRTQVTNEAVGGIDGIEPDGSGGLLVTDVIGQRLLHVAKSGQVRVLAKFSAGGADFGYIGAKRMAIVPFLFGNKVAAYDLTECPQVRRSIVVVLARASASGRSRCLPRSSGVAWRMPACNLTRAAFSNVDAPIANLYFNQASPSAYVRGNTRAVPLALAYMRTLERLGARVLNGADVFALELSKSAQATLLHTLGIDTPWSVTFNDVTALRAYSNRIQWPAILKPDQGGSGARIHVVESLAHVEAILAADPGLWLPENLLLLQEYLPHDPEQGIVRLEFLAGSCSTRCA